MRAAIFASALLCGCSALGENGTAGHPCEPIPGFYKVTTKETSGDCGNTENLVEVGRPGSSPPKDSGCSGRRWWSASECSMNMDVVCDLRDEHGRKLGVVLKMRGSVIWKASDFASGVVQMEIEDNSKSATDLSCTSVSNIYYRRVE